MMTQEEARQGAAAASASASDDEETETVENNTAVSKQSQLKLSQNQVKDRLLSKKFTVELESSRKAKCWKLIGAVLDEDGKILPFVACSKCSTVFNRPFGGRHGTTTLNAHVDSCPKNIGTVSSTLHDHFQTIKVPQADKNIMVDACAYYCAKDMRPFLSVEGRGFAKVIEAGIYLGHKLGKVAVEDILPCANAVSSHVSKKAELGKSELSGYIAKEMRDLGGGVSTDIWTNDAGFSFLSCDTHFINQNFELVEKLLETALFSEHSHTAQNVRTLMNNLLEKFGLLEIIDKLCFATDHASNMRAAFETVQPVCARVTCVCHRINTVLEDAFSPQKSPSIPQTVQDLYDSCKSLVTFMKQSRLNRHLPKKLVQDTPTRWLSRTDMFESILVQHKEIRHVLLLYRENELHRYNNIDIPLLEEILPFLKKFNRAILELEVTKEPTLHKVSPIWCFLDRCCKDKAVDGDELSLLKLRVRQLLDIKSQVQDMHLAATALSPQWRDLDHKVCPFDRRDDAYDYLKLLMKKFAPNVAPIENVKKRSALFKRSLLDDSSDASSDDEAKKPQEEEESGGGVETELRQYLNMAIKADKDIDILDFWKQFQFTFPRLSRVARHLLAVPASSASSERDFSAAGFIYGKLRQSLAPSSVDSLTFLKANLPDDYKLNSE